MLIDVINKIVNKRDARQDIQVATIDEIHPEQLFSKDILNFSVDTKQLGKVPYVNLDNAATTPPHLSTTRCG